MTPVSFCAHQNRLLISQGTVEIWVCPMELDQIIASAAIVLQDKESGLFVSRGDDELTIPRDLVPAFILEAAKARSEPITDH